MEGHIPAVWMTADMSMVSAPQGRGQTQSNMVVAILYYNSELFCFSGIFYPIRRPSFNLLKINNKK